MKLALSLALALFAFIPNALAQDYPNRVITRATLNQERAEFVTVLGELGLLKTRAAG